jgi:hypothetical protein
MERTLLSDPFMGGLEVAKIDATRRRILQKPIAQSKFLLLRGLLRTLRRARDS